MAGTLLGITRVLSFTLLLCISCPGETASVNNESLVKAAFIYKFLLFTDFPNWAYGDAPEELSICIYGPSRFNGAFDPVEGKRIQGRKLRIKTVSAQSGRREVEDCHILFIGEDNRPEVTKHMLSVLKGSPILTVGEHDAFLKWGGMIRIYVEGGKIAFDVNADSAKNAGISFRAQMLRIAKRVLE